MIDILNRWRQFGRCYFWSHLLLGMVAATIGVPVTTTGFAFFDPFPSVSCLNYLANTQVTVRNLVLLQGACRRPAYQPNYWQQHTVRSAIRHLSWALSAHSLIQDEEKPIHAQQLALLNTLSLFLAQKRHICPITTSSPILAIDHVITSYHSGLWIAQVQGIRAGPENLT